ncbi:MAG: alpha/beta hydrolase [Planctomycetes bacterium]|nr:alpha/beta hydrolase [Planctomycetota bacterium]
MIDKKPNSDITPDGQETSSESTTSEPIAGKRPRKKLTWKQQLKRMGILFAGIYVVLFLIAAFGCDSLLFRPPESNYADSSAILKIKTADGQTLSAQSFYHIEDTVIQNRRFGNSLARYTIIYSHGNAEDMGEVGAICELIKNAGFNVLAYDYRGYGTSTGSPSEEGTYRDIDAAYDYVTKTLNVPPGRIIILGRSIGGGPSVDLTIRRPVAGLILESSFTSAFRIPTRINILPWDKFDNLSKIRQVHCPVLVIHGENDWVISSWHGKKLFESANEPKRCLWVDGAGHNDLVERAGQKYFQALKDFADLLEKK